ncbi:MAG: hypothetical protein JXB39_03135 [Deltaproteobacteria bacterium]|nr:hypothetical protein [Deltaproteobacteria bacterium]
MDPVPDLPIQDFLIRGCYPNAWTFAAWREEGHHDARSGLRGPVVEYELGGERHVLNVREMDVKLLNHRDPAVGLRHLSLLVAARQGHAGALAELEAALAPIVADNVAHYEDLGLVEDATVVPSTSRAPPDPGHLSQKGASLLALTQEGYPVPDFCVLTSAAHDLPPSDRERLTAIALRNLERMTRRKLDSSTHPLVFAMRYAMPDYIPGLMPTYLNVGVTRATWRALRGIYGPDPADRMFLNNLRNLRALLDPSSLDVPLAALAGPAPTEDREALIAHLASDLGRRAPGLLHDAVRQACFFVHHVHRYFQENEELIFTFTRGRRLLPSILFQQMICTVRGDGSYPGVLYSRNPRTGRGRVVESVRNIFGEDIMTGTVQTENDEFDDREQIRDRFPAVYHVEPLLAGLERRASSTVTVEFAAETVRRGHFFALLQLNPSEMTGRATLVSAMDMVAEGIVPARRVPELVKPYHLRQIVSDSIDPRSMERLTFFSQGFSILPRTAASARIYFNAGAALEARRRGERVCFCKDRFVPSDTVVMGEMDIVLSLAPAAIHVVTACRGFGIPAFLNLERYGVRLEEGRRLVNAQGLVLEEGDWLTVSSKRRTLFCGQADFMPSRYQKYLTGERFPLEAREAEVFGVLKDADAAYRHLVASLDVEEIESLAELAKLVRSDLKGDPERSAELVNHWFDANTDAFVTQVLAARLGTHQELLEVYRCLTTDRQAVLQQRAVARCRAEGLRGLEAGSFMLGRFVAVPHRTAFWRALDDADVAFLLDEWVSFLKYMQVLDDVGERRLVRARQVVMGERLAPIRIASADVRVFAALKLTGRAMTGISAAAAENAETSGVIDLLSGPWSALFDSPWSRQPLVALCAEEGLPVPEDR